MGSHKSTKATFESNWSQFSPKNFQTSEVQQKIIAVLFLMFTNITAWSAELPIAKTVRKYIDRKQKEFSGKFGIFLIDIKYHYSTTSAVTICVPIEKYQSWFRKLLAGGNFAQFALVRIDSAVRLCKFAVWRKGLKAMGPVMRIILHPVEFLLGTSSPWSQKKTWTQLDLDIHFDLDVSYETWCNWIFAKSVILNQA